MSLQFDRIHKSFGAVNALRGVSFDVAEGEAHALVGENGAGKSTLLKILAGLVRPTPARSAGRASRSRRPSPRDAIEHGIGMVYQEMLCFPNLSVSANIFCGREITPLRPARRSGDASAHARGARSPVAARSIRTRSPNRCPPRIGSCCRSRARSPSSAAILVLDEPTTALTDAEADHLFDVLRELKRGGTTMLYVSHRLPEVFRLCDRITVLRDGAFVGTFTTAEVTPNDIVRAMVGRDLPRGRQQARAVSPKREARQAGHGPCEDGQPRLSTNRLPEPALPEHQLSRVWPRRDRRPLRARRLGTIGAARNDLRPPPPDRRRACCSTARRSTFRSPRDAARAGIALVPEERQRQGLFFNLDLRHNLVLPTRHAERRRADRQRREERRDAGRLLGDWRIKAAGIDALPDTLSGGNQQKVVRRQVAGDQARACCCSTSRPRAWMSAPSSRSTR